MSKDYTITVPAVPHSREAEESVLGSVLINPEVFHECRLQLPDGALEFWLDRNKWIWQGMEALVENNIPIDHLTLSEQLKKDGKLEEVGGFAYLTSLLNATPTSLNAYAHAVIVHENYVRRQMLNAANEIATLGYKGESLESVASQATHVLSEAVKLSAPKNLITIAESVKIVDAMIEENGKLEDLPGIPTPWIDLNKMMGGGSQNSDLNMIAGRPGDGKSTALVQLAINSARYTQNMKVQTKRIALFSLEMPHEQIILRLLAQLSGIDFHQLRAGRIPDDKYDKYYQAIDTLSTLDIVIDDRAAASPAYVRSRCEMIAGSGGLDLLCLDSLNLMNSGMNFRSDHVEVDYNATQLKNIARDFNIPVWCAHQMNRSIEGRGENSRPKLSDMREGGEQPADMVMFVHHEKDEDGEIKESEFVIAKHRNGQTGNIPVVFRKEYTRFENAVKIKF